MCINNYMAELRVGILSSGKTEQVQAVINTAKNSTINISIGLIIITREDENIRQLAQANNIELKVINGDLFPSREDYDVKLAEEFWATKCSFIILANYTKLLNIPFLRTFPDRVLNIHSSLLPAFSGRGMFGSHVLRATLERQVTLTGCTLYVLNEELASGTIMGQYPIQINYDDNFDSVNIKINSCYQELLSNVLPIYLESLGTIDFSKSPASLQSVFKADHHSDKHAVIIHDKEYFNDERKIYTAEINSIKSYALCDVGLERSENMDTVLLTSDNKVFSVADGVGSAEGGKQTSRLISRTLSDKWNLQKNLHKIKGQEHGDWLRKTIIEGNRDLVQWNRKLPKPFDLGSTLIAGIYDDQNDDIYIANVGDSRAYLWRDNTLYRLTRDHSEDYDPEYDDGGALLYYIGGEKDAFGIDLYQLKIYKNDTIILCSDGLLYAKENNIANILAKYNGNNEELAHKLLEKVYENEAPDNTGIVILAYE